MIFNNFLSSLFYKAEEILMNDRDSRPAILVRNKVGP